MIHFSRWIDGLKVLLTRAIRLDTTRTSPSSRSPAFKLAAAKATSDSTTRAANFMVIACQVLALFVDEKSVTDAQYARHRLYIVSLSYQPRGWCRKMCDFVEMHF